MSALDPVQQYAKWSRRELFHECVRLRNAELRRAKQEVVGTIPAEPTNRMIAAGRDVITAYSEMETFETLAIVAYRAMVAEALGLQDEDSDE